MKEVRAFILKAIHFSLWTSGAFAHFDVRSKVMLTTAHIK